MSVRSVSFRLRLFVVVLLLPLAFVPNVAADDAYDQGVWIKWDTAEIDVLVTGIADPVVGAAIDDAIASWQAGIDQLAAPWLRDGLQLRVYRPDVDPVPPEGFEPLDIEIYVVPQGFFAVTTQSFGDPVCFAFAPLGYEFAFFGRTALYRVAAHEFGHCLGLEHVFNHGREYEPAFDIMGGGRDFKACPSNLNIRVLELAYGGLFGQPSGGALTMPSGEYMQSAC